MTLFEGGDPFVGFFFFFELIASLCTDTIIYTHTEQCGDKDLAHPSELCMSLELIDHA